MSNSLFSSFETLTEQGIGAAKAQVQASVTTTSQQVNGHTQSSSDGTQSHITKDQNDFVNDMYKPTDVASAHLQPSVLNSIRDQVIGAPKKDDEALAKARQELATLSKKQHKDLYFIPTFEQRPQEERAAEKVEREENEEKQKRWELQQKKQKEDIVVTRAKNSAEQFRGAAG